MGDVLHALPAVTALRKLRPALRIGWAVDPRWAPLLVNEDGTGPVVSEIYPVDTRLWSKAPFSRATLRSVLHLRGALRAERYERAVDLQGTLRSAAITRMAGANRTFGYSNPREAPAAWTYSERLPRRGAHVIAQNAALLGEGCGELLNLQPALQSPPQSAPLPVEGWAEAWAEDLWAGERICVLAASAGWEAKQWGAARYGALAIALQNRGFRVLTNAPRKDDPVAAQVVAVSGGAAALVVCNVPGLVALLRRTVLVVGGDTGPVHLAAMLGVPLVALFGPTDPARNGPWGPGPKRVLRHPSSVTSYSHVPTADPGLAQVSVAEVLQAVEEVLHANGPAEGENLP